MLIQKLSNYFGSPNSEKSRFIIYGHLRVYSPGIFSICFKTSCFPINDITGSNGRAYMEESHQYHMEKVMDCVMGEGGLGEYLETTLWRK